MAKRSIKKLKRIRRKTTKRIGRAKAAGRSPTKALLKRKKVTKALTRRNRPALGGRAKPVKVGRGGRPGTKSTVPKGGPAKLKKRKR